MLSSASVVPLLELPIDVVDPAGGKVKSSFVLSSDCGVDDDPPDISLLDVDSAALEVAS